MIPWLNYGDNPLGMRQRWSFQHRKRNNEKLKNLIKWVSYAGVSGRFLFCFYIFVSHISLKIKKLCEHWAGTSVFTENSVLILAKVGGLQWKSEWVNMSCVLSEGALVQHKMWQWSEDQYNYTAGSLGATGKCWQLQRAFLVTFADGSFVTLAQQLFISK